MTTTEPTIRGDQIDLASRYLHFVHQMIQLRVCNSGGAELVPRNDFWGFVLKERVVELLQRDGLDDDDWKRYEYYRTGTVRQNLRELVPNPDSTDFNVKGLVAVLLPDKHPLYGNFLRPKLGLFRKAVSRFFLAVACSEITEEYLKSSA